MKLKYSEVSVVRSKMLIEQEYKCALCGELIIDDPVLDHDHKTGKIRKVLHRGCNSLEGKLVNNLARSKMTQERLRIWLERVYDYIHSEYDDIIHPTHKTPEERIELRKRKAKLRRKRNASS